MADGARGRWACRSRQRQRRQVSDHSRQITRTKAPEGYIHLPSQTYQGFALLRSILKSRGDADIAKAVAYGKRIRLYPLSVARDTPPETKFIDAAGASWLTARFRMTCASLSRSTE